MYEVGGVSQQRHLHDVVGRGQYRHDPIQQLFHVLPWKQPALLKVQHLVYGQ